MPLEEMTEEAIQSLILKLSQKENISTGIVFLVSGDTKIT